MSEFLTVKEIGPKKYADSENWILLASCETPLNYDTDDENRPKFLDTIFVNCKTIELLREQTYLGMRNLYNTYNEIGYFRHSDRLSMDSYVAVSLCESIKKMDKKFYGFECIINGYIHDNGNKNSNFITYLFEDILRKFEGFKHE